jgi:hypothetical protein
MDDVGAFVVSGDDLCLEEFMDLLIFVIEKKNWRP